MGGSPLIERTTTTIAAATTTMVSSPIHHTASLTERLVKTSITPSPENSYGKNTINNNHKNNLDNVVHVDDDTPLSDSDSDHEENSNCHLNVDTPPKAPIRKATSTAIHTPHSKGCSSSSNANCGKSVAFGNIYSRSYNVIMGDHPCCSMGCPLSLGWEYQPTAKVITIDEYESTRSPRRTKDKLRTTWDERRTILSDVSDDEVKRAQRKFFREKSCQRKVQSRVCAAFFQPGHDGDSRSVTAAAAASTTKQACV